MIKDHKKLGIGIFAYNRPSHLRRVLISLENNNIKQATIFLDGPKNQKDIVIQKEIFFMVNQNPFIELKLIKSKKNVGLAKAIMNGVKYLLKKHKNIIIIEDDCVPRGEFFKFILNIIQTSYYKKNLNPICGYQFPEIQKLNKKNLHSVFLNYFLPWGWCINSVYWKNYLNYLKSKKNFKIDDEIIKKINNLAKGKPKSIWSKNFIKFNLINKKKIIFPTISLIKNIGFDGSGVNSKVTNKLSTEYVKTKKTLKFNEIFFNEELEKNQKIILNKRLRYFF